jgi:hypothetical protein
MAANRLEYLYYRTALYVHCGFFFARSEFVGAEFFAPLLISLLNWAAFDIRAR